MKNDNNWTDEVTMTVKTLTISDRLVGSQHLENTGFRTR